MLLVCIRGIVAENFVYDRRNDSFLLLELLSTDDLVFGSNTGLDGFEKFFSKVTFRLLMLRFASFECLGGNDTVYNFAILLVGDLLT